jgi:hypothetical protein
MRPTTKTARALLGLAACLVAGCARTPPPVTEAEGTVLLNGKPLPNAKVQFIPQLQHFGAELNSVAVTDEKGFFLLTCLKGEPGAVVARHKVLVSEAPPPAEFRRPDGDTQERYANYLRGMTNRPIPQEYGSLRTTRLEVEVTPGQKTYELKLTR